MRVRDWLSVLAGFAAIAVSIFAVGGVLRWSQAAVALLVAVSIAAIVLSRRGLARMSPLIALLGIACVLTAVQLVPLPAALLERLSPPAHALREDGAALLDVSPAQTLTSDQPATLGALAFFLILLGIASVTLRIATSEKGRYRIVAAVAAMCGLVAVTVGIHRLFGLRALYGLYEPQYASPGMLGPILNSNSLACLMAVGATLAIGLAAYRRQPGWLRAVWLVIVAGCGVITVATVSRGATLAFAAGGLVTVCVLVGQRLLGHEVSRKRRTRFMTNALPIGVVAGCMVVLVIWSNAGNVERQLSQLSFSEVSHSRSKFAAWRSAAHLVEETPWLGIGRGAFESAFTRVHPASGVATYSHLENEYLQVVVDWGVLGALAVACAAIWLAVVAIKRWRDGPLAAGALGALAIVAIQSNVDFGVEFLGLAAPITAIAATLVYVPLRELIRAWPARALRVTHVCALVVMAGLLLSSKTMLLDEDRQVLSNEPSFANVRAAAERHPLDYYSFAIAAELFERSNDPRAIGMLNHALLLHPTHPGLHRFAARLLYRKGFIDQATIEFAAALRATPQSNKLIAEIVELYPRERAALALPVDYPEVEALVRTLVELGRTDVAIGWLARVLAHRSNHSRACEQMFRLAQNGEIGAATIGVERCPEMLPDYQTRLLLAQAMMAKQAHAGVLKLLHDVEGWQSRVDDKVSAWLTRCDAHARLGSVDEAKRCLRRLDASPDMRAERRGEIITRLEALQKPAAPPAPVPATGSAAPSP